jgi:sugar phosphate isomerase/epimerase
MKESIAIPSLDSFQTREALDGALGRIAEFGYSAVEPLIGVLKDDRFSIKAEEYTRILDKHRLGVSGFRTGLIYRELGFGFSHMDKTKREAAVEAVCSAVEFTALFPGAKILNGLIQGPPPEGYSMGETKNHVRECIEECLERAEKHGCPFCIEPVNRYELPYNNTLAEVGEMISRIDSSALGLLIDTFHMNIEEADMEQAIRRHSRHIRAVHFMDSNRLPPGYGHLPLGNIFDVLREVGYQGYLTIEMAFEKTNEDFFSWAEKGLAGLHVIDPGLNRG